MTWKKALIIAAAVWAAILVHTLATHAEYRPQPTIVVDTEVIAGSVARYANCEDDIEADENLLIEQALLRQATRIDNATITYYCRELRPHICGTGDGITATGERASNVTCAVDPALIPLGSQVMVDYGDGDIQYYIAQDTGSSITGAHLDICVATHAEALQLGKRTATVYYIAPERIDKD